MRKLWQKEEFVHNIRNFEFFKKKKKKNIPRIFHRIFLGIFQGIFPLGSQSQAATWQARRPPRGPR
jgi:hypothetical protein